MTTIQENLNMHYIYLHSAQNYKIVIYSFPCPQYLLHPPICGQAVGFLLRLPVDWSCDYLAFSNSQRGLGSLFLLGLG